MRSLVLAASVASLLGVSSVALAAEECRVGWSHYTGWEPFALAQSGSDLSVELLDTYADSLEQFSTGSLPAVAMTTIDALSIAASSGIDTTILTLTGESAGNDTILVKNATGAVQSIDDLKDRSVILDTESKVSLFVLNYALSQQGLSLDDVKLVNVNDKDIVAEFAKAEEGTAVVTWNPHVITIFDTVDGVNELFSSASMPGMVLDAIAVRSDASDACKQEILNQWRIVVSQIETEGAIQVMAESAAKTATDVADPVDWFRAQVDTTRYYSDPATAHAVLKGLSLKATMTNVREFAFSQGYLGGVNSASDIGIEYPDGAVDVSEIGKVFLRFVSLN